MPSSRSRAMRRPRCRSPVCTIVATGRTSHGTGFAGDGRACDCLPIESMVLRVQPEVFRGATTSAEHTSTRAPPLLRARTQPLLENIQQSLVGHDSKLRFELLHDDQQEESLNEEELQVRAAQQKELDRLNKKLLRVQNKLDAASKKLQENSDKCDALVCQSPRCTGIVFVTFQHEASAQRLLAAASTKSRGLSGITVRVPPEPEEVFWDQLQQSDAARFRRQCASSALLATLALVAIALTGYARHGISELQQHAAWNTQREAVVALG
eukprot:5194500-Prymnesium_polylepis.1